MAISKERSMTATFEGKTLVASQSLDERLERTEKIIERLQDLLRLNLILSGLSLVALASAALIKRDLIISILIGIWG